MTNLIGRRWRTTRCAIAIVLLLTVVVESAVQPVHADPVSQQQQHVKDIADQLDSISARIDHLDLEYTAAQDRETALIAQVADAQTKVDALQAQADTLQATMSVIAVDSYTSGAPQLSPVFSNPSAYADAQQRTELARLSVDGGAGDLDQAHAVVVQLENSKADLAKKQKQSAAEVSTLAQAQAEADVLAAQYQTKYAAAKADLGDLVQQEQARRVAEASAKADALAAQHAAAAAVPAKSSATAQAPPVEARGNGAAAESDASKAAAAPAAAAPAMSDAAMSAMSDTPSAKAATPAQPDPPSPPPPSSRASIVVAAAMGQLGVPYVFAAESPGVAFDCSGLTMWAWSRVGVSMPHFAASQYATQPHVTRDQIEPGDLIFYGAPIGHVAIYIGNGQYIHAPRTGDVVRTGTVDWSTVVGISRPG